MKRADDIDLLNVKWKEYKAGTIARQEFDDFSVILFDRYLAAKHLKDGSLDIFKKLLHEAKDKYGIAKDNYYLGRINITRYIWDRGLAVGKGVSWFDFKIVELGLGTELLPKKDREHFSWKSLKIEREIMPDRLINPDNINNCPKENESAAAQTLIVFFELIDFYNKNYVPSLEKNWKVRDLAWIDIPGEADAFDKPYLDVTVTPRERLQYEQWRDGIGAGPGISVNR